MNNAINQRAFIIHDEKQVLSIQNLMGENNGRDSNYLRFYIPTCAQNFISQEITLKHRNLS